MPAVGRWRGGANFKLPATRTPWRPGVISRDRTSGTYCVTWAHGPASPIVSAAGHLAARAKCKMRPALRAGNLL